jgi:hypothetical protein
MKILFLLLFGASLLSAETRQERGKRVVDEALAALGGDRYLAVKDRVESGRVYSFYREQLSGLSVAKWYVQYLDRPEDAPADFIGLRERQIRFAERARCATNFWSASN